MENTMPRCTVPVEIAGKICEFGLRPDRNFSRVPVDIWRLFKATLRPISPPDLTCGDDLTGCLGLCNATFSVLNRNLTDHSVVVSRDPIPTLGLSTLMDLHLVYNFGNFTVRLADDIPVGFDSRNDFERHREKRSGSRFEDLPQAHPRRYYEREEDYLADQSFGGPRVDQLSGLRRRSITDYPDNHIKRSIVEQQSEFYRDNQSDPFDDWRNHGNYSPNYRQRPESEDISFGYRRGEHENFRSDADYLQIEMHKARSQGFDDHLGFEENSSYRPNRSRDGPGWDNNSFEQNSTQQLGILSDISSQSRREPDFKRELFGGSSYSQMVRNRRIIAGKNASLSTSNKQSSQPPRSLQNAKKIKQKSRPQCNICRKYGHKAEVCRNAMQNSSNNPAPAPQIGKVLNPWESWVLGDNSRNGDNIGDGNSYVMQMLQGRNVVNNLQ